MSATHHESTQPDDSKTPGTRTPFDFRAAQRNALPYWLARGAPVLTARRASSREWVVDVCPHCGGTHRHGAMPGHRTAPCGHELGYILLGDLTGVAA